MKLSQINEIHDLLIAYAGGEYHKKGKISEDRDEIDMIITGVNMLGEELLATTVSRDYFSGIYNAVSNMVLVLSLKGEIEDSNSAVLDLLGYQNSVIKGKSIDAIVDEGNSSFFETSKNALGKDEVSTQKETRLISTNEKTIPVSSSFSKIIDKRGKLEGYLVVAEDMTEREEMEKLILRTIVETQEKEQKRVADDLHDSLGQELSTVKLLLSAINNNVQSSDANYVAAFETCKNLLDSSIDNVRSICFNLMPASLERGGIEAALEELVQRLGQHDLIRFSLDIPDEIPTLDGSMEIAIYRVAQEFISNSTKHAQASEINIGLYLSQAHIQFDIEDNGVGFELDEKKYVDGGRGLSTMRSRVKAFNGSFKFASKTGQGTRLSIKFQLPELHGET